MRPTTPADAEQIMRLLWQYFQENQAIMPMEIELDLDECWAYIRRALQSEKSIGYISDDGVFLGHLSKPWFSKTCMAGGLLWYVKPEARNGILARNFIRAFDKEAKERGAVYAQMALDNAAHLNVIGPLMNKFGYEDYSKVFLKHFTEKPCST
jgi:uncharacterized protein (DUF2235 family)